MGLETATYISGLNASNPINATDVVGEGDDHLRLIKSCLLNTFPAVTGAVTASHTELNILDGVTKTAAQINDSAELAADNEFTGQNSFARNSELNIMLERPGATTDAKNWAIGIASGGGLLIRTAFDDDSTGDTLLQATRSGVDIQQLTFNADVEVEINTAGLDVNAASDFSGSMVVHNIIQSQSTAPGFRLREDGVTTDQSVYEIRGDGERFTIRLLNDAASAQTTCFAIDRTLNNPDKITIIADEIQLDSSNLDFNGPLDLSDQLLAAAGSASAPSISFAGDPDTGFYNSGANGIAVAAGASVCAAFSNSQCQFNTTEVDLTCTTLDVNATTLDFAGTVTTPNSNAKEVGFKGFPQSAEDANDYSFVLSDAGQHVEYTGTGGHTFTIPANASVAFPVGTVLGIVNDGSGDLTVAITSDTLVWAGVGSTGSRTLGANGQCSMLKVDSTKWYISGPGLT